MASTPEGKVKQKVKEVLKRHNIYWFCPVQNGMGVVGTPDFLCCVDGKFLAIETKAPGKLSSVTPNQEARMDDIRASGGLAIVVSDASAVEAAIAALKSSCADPVPNKERNEAI